MKKILVLGNTGLNSSNNSTNNRMKKIFEVMHTQYGFTFDYYKLREAVLEVDYINYLNKKADANPIHAYKTIVKENKHYEIVLAETFNAVIVAYMFFLKTKTPFIWRQFGNSLNDELNFKNYFKPKILLKFLLHKVISNSKGCKAVVCTEDGCANRTLYIDKLGMSIDRLYMIKNQRTEQSVEAIKLLSSKTNIFKVVQVGRITAWKKIHILVDALINIKNKYPKISEKIELDIIGQTQDREYENSLREKIKEYKLEKNITFKKDLQYHDIEEIFKTTDLSISLTAYNPIIESLQNEIPVITYEYGEIGEVFNDCKAVFILAKGIKKSSFLSKEQEAQITEELAEQIRVLFKEKGLIELGKEGKLFVEKHFPLLDEHVNEIISIYIKEIDAL
jgi:glycosyltransferase involved in cell wall biosynthesis